MFKETVQRIKEGNKDVKIELINRIFSLDGLIIHHKDKKTKRIIASDCSGFEYAHEFHTSKKLTAVHYNVLFVPKGYFKRSDKKFDVFLLFLSKDHLFFESELKCLHTKKPDTMGNRIKEGSSQTSKLILDIHAEINKMDLIDGLRLGCQRNELIKQIMLFYKSQFYLLDKNKILSKNIYRTL